ncbi:pyridoxamine 5'-phosphate oxidase family protein [Rhizobium sp. Root482]|uniref:pyridoxamine 5'-phosphate oxidase family protein n=1 Tax=Rhizobium sp. Root482 TaxID=1736543 RepID=UPI0006F68055|nr:pyridoxamine 5'-phosphate oxidase family protein [Rhizobium sp. Root482]KQY13353.1 pyridoxamine 5'-phosphate oxidase [Rhizobium sp. Root482]
MSEKSLSEIAKRMRDIDIAMLSTHTDGGAIAGRPMSNNREVDYDGDSYYFTWEKSRMVEDIRGNSKVSLAFQGKKAFSVAVEGQAEVIKDKAEFKDHWTPDLDQWFEDGIDTKGVVMIKISATRLHYWDGEDEGEVKLSAKRRK